LSKGDFICQAKTLQGSRDFGAQLFCSLLRSTGVEARLVCSLQPLPFSGSVKDMTPVKTDRKYIVISSDDHETSTDELNRPGNPPTPSRARRIGQPQFIQSLPSQTPARSGLWRLSPIALRSFGKANVHRSSSESSRILMSSVLGGSLQ
jgi:xeroderma pigmentosum group C-complementing protein